MDNFLKWDLQLLLKHRITLTILLMFFILGPLTDENSEKKQKSEASLSELIDKKDGKVLKKICRPMTGLALSFTELEHIL